MPGIRDRRPTSFGSAKIRIGVGSLVVGAVVWYLSCYLPSEVVPVVSLGRHELHDLVLRMQRALTCALLTIAACFSPRYSDLTMCGPAGDCPEGRSCIAGFCKANIDAAVPDGTSPDAAPCVPWDALNLSPTVTPCDTALGVPVDLSLAAGAYAIDTDSGQISGDVSAQLPGVLILQSSGSEMLRVVNLGQFSIANGATVVITGRNPLVFVVHADATIAGILDVSARVDGTGTSTAGPGADDADACTGGFGAVGQAAQASTGGGGGAGGGGFGNTGGNGGDGNGTGLGFYGVHGSATGNMTLVPLRGGCPGGHGGATSSLTAGGRAGDGGGALEVTARGVIDVRGTLKAAGSGGGTPGSVNAGGGAGGSGGAILLDGDTVHVEASGTLCANGGGGGEGGQVGGTSAPGENGTCSATQAARGGTGNATGGDGGDGGSGSSTLGKTGANGVSSGGGGGGGGSVGRVRVRGRTTRTIDPSAIVSPAAAP